MELKTYLTIISRRIGVVAGCFIVLMLLVILGAFLIPPKYTSTASLRIFTPKSGGANYIDFNIYYATRLMNTYASLASSKLIEDKIMSSLKLTKKPDIAVSVIADSEIIKITAEDKDPNLSAVLANSIADMLVQDSKVYSEEAQKAAGKAINDRMDQLNKELATVRKTYEALIIPQTNYNNQIVTLNNQIAYDQQIYLSLKSIYEQNLQVVRRDEVAFTNLQTQISNLEKQIADNQSKADALSQKVSESAVKIAAAQGDITLKEQEYTTLITQLDQIQALQIIQGSNQLSVVEKAVPANKPSSPNYLLIYAVGILVSLFGAIVAAFVVDNLDDTIFNPDQIETLFQGTYLGKISSTRNFLQKLVKKSEPDQQLEINRLRQNLTKILQQQEIYSLILCSTVSNDGSALLTASLAKSYAGAGSKVVLIDAKPNNPFFHANFPDLVNKDGLNQFLANGLTAQKIIHETNIPNLSIILSGPPALIKSTTKFDNLITQLNKNHDLTLIDFPSLLIASDFDRMINAVDGVVLIIEQGRSKEKDVHTVIKYLQDLDAQLIGYVITSA